MGRAKFPANAYVEDRGRRYRVCYASPKRILMIFLQFPKLSRKERCLEHEGRRWRQIAKLAEAEPRPW